MSETKRKIILKKLKKGEHDTVWHPESTLVFKSQKERLVIGRWVDDTFISLDEDAIALCEEWSFKPDESLMDSEEGEEEEEADDGEEEGNVSKNSQEDNSSEKEEGETSEEIVPKNNNTKISPNTLGILPPSGLGNSALQPILDDLVGLVGNLQKQIDSLSVSNGKLTVDLEEKTREYSDLEKKYESINSKFTTMKSLFN